MHEYALYMQQKAAWLRANPGATAQQIEDAFKAIAERLGI